MSCYVRQNPAWFWHFLDNEAGRRQMRKCLTRGVWKSYSSAINVFEDSAQRRAYKQRWPTDGGGEVGTNVFHLVI